MRPWTTEDLEALHTRARVRLERRRHAPKCFVCAAWDGSDRPAGHGGLHGESASGWQLVREAAALVAAIDARLSENQERGSWGDR